MPILWLLLVSLVPVSAEDETLDLRRFLARYKSGDIDASVIGRLIPSLEPPPAFPRYERARAKLREKPTVAGARVLLEAAVLRLDEDPEAELRRFAPQQPWVIRRRAIDDLGEHFLDVPIQEWAAELLADEDLDVDRRRVLIEYLGAAHRQVPRASNELILFEALGHADPGVRANAVTALGPIASRHGLHRLVKALYDAEPQVRARAALSARSALDRLEPELDDEDWRRWMPLIAHRLDDEDSIIRMHIAELIRHHLHPSALPYLIEALAAEEDRAGTVEARGRFRVAVEDSLLLLSGAGSVDWTAEQWSSWYERNGVRIAGEEELPKRTVDLPAKKTVPTYFGREVESDHVVFVMDFSGSMRRRPGTVAHDSGEGDRLLGSRIQLARGHFRRYLEALDETHYFNVVIFAVGAQAAFDDLVPATPANRTRAWAFVEQVKLGGETDLFAGIVKGLRTSGLGADVRFGTKADTLYLLSDGVPTAGAVTDPGDIVRTITKMNESSGLRIHVVDLGARHKAFQRHLERLALSNEGEYIRAAGE